MKLYRNKYRIEPARLQDWDYSLPGHYFVTLCAFEHICIFGEIIDNEMHLNENGEIVLQEWDKSFTIRRELKRDDFCIMPNHFHTIVRIVDTNFYGHCRDARPIFGDLCRDARPCVSTEIPENRESEPNHGIAYRAPKSISSLIAGFKSTATKRINENRKTPRAPVWQPRFHDHIIRDNKELFAIRQYIKNNPANWENDRNIIETNDKRTGKQPWFVYMG